MKDRLTENEYNNPTKVPSKELLLYKGRDGQDYNSLERLQAADKQWGKTYRPFKDFDGKNYGTSAILKAC